MAKDNNLKKIQVILISLFFFSGVAGLAYQIIWVKLLSQMFGHTIYAITTVVATFMTGLAIGSYFFGKLADRSQSTLKLYAKIEIGIGVFALIILFFNPFFNDVYASIFKILDLGFSTFSVSRFIYAFMILIIPTALIGGTFPVISRYYIRQIKNIQRDTGTLYAVNTFGAVIGAVLTGFFLLEWLGITKTSLIMITINFALAGTVLLIDRQKSDPVVASNTDDTHEGISFILIIYALSGFVSLALEVLWTRELSIVFLSSTYSFSTVLVTFLIGLTAGSLFFANKRIDLRNAIKYFYRIEFGIAVMALLSIPLLRYIPQKVYIEAVAQKSITWHMETFYNYAVSFSILIIPTFLMGVAFPLVCSIYTRSFNRIGTDLGRVYAYNTTGSILGSLVAGFVLIPQFGVVNSINIVAVIAFMLVIAIIIKYTSFKESKFEHLLIVIIFIGLFFILSIKGNGFRPLPPGTSVLYAKEDIGAEVKVLKNKRGDISLYINEKQQGGTQVSQTERWAGQVPLVFHSQPDSVLLIGLGTGITLNAIAEGPVKHITCVDLIGSLVEASELFKDINGDILSNKERVQFIEADGINYLALVPDKYDLIVCDIIHPDDAGAGDLYSVEFYQSCRSRLRKDGIFVQWLLLDQLAPVDLNIILATFRTIFPGMQLYMGQEQTKFQKLMILGYENNSFFRFSKIKENLNNLPFINEFNGTEDPYSFLTFFITGGKSLEHKFGSVKLNSRDHPIIEYQSPKHRWKRSKGVQNIKYLDMLREPVFNYLEMDSTQRRLATRYFNTRSYVIKGRLEEYSGNYKTADVSFSEAALMDVDTILVSKLLANIAWKLLEKNDFESAILSFKKSIATNHRNINASIALAELLYKLKRIDESIEFFRYAVHYDPDNFHAYRRLGDIFTQLKNFDNAFYYYRKSTEAEYNQPILHYILGQIYYNHKKKYTQAAASFKASLELDPFHQYNQNAQKALKELENLVN